ncbi:SDR family oxidoreductase, partial [Lysinibacillus xylanilyticus]|uniref:SDR family oxidoreductase n=1 Tax=Lysinibacillus xylanilyticus TaxID=582475 RepID=UPI0036DF6E48
DLLVNIPAMGYEVKFEALNELELDLIVRDGLFGIFNGVQYLQPLLEQSAQAKVVNIYPQSQLQQKVGFAGAVVAASLDMLTKCLANELKRYGIKVNSICPVNKISEVLKEPKVISEITNTLDSILHDRGKKLTGQIYSIDKGRRVLFDTHVVSEVLNV